MIERTSRNTLILDRKWFTAKSTIGELLMDGEVFCYTLEDTCREAGIKVPGATAIPSGTYQLIVKQSPRRGYEVPWLLNVPGFEDIQMHRGNTDVDTLGCILVGMRHDLDITYDSKTAFNYLMPEIKKRIAEAPLFIAIYGGTRPPEPKKETNT